MAGLADNRIPLLRSTGIEVGAMRTDLEGAELGMTGETVALGVARRAGLETAAGGAAVAKQPERLGIVVDGAEQAAP